MYVETYINKLIVLRRIIEIQLFPFVLMTYLAAATMCPAMCVINLLRFKLSD